MIFKSLAASLSSTLEPMFATFFCLAFRFHKMNIPSGVNVGVPPQPLEPLKWLIGTWRCQKEEGQGSFPTIKDFQYGDEITFANIGQPMLNYQSCSWHPEMKCPMHLETGFLKIKPGTSEVSFILAHNFGTYITILHFENFMKLHLFVDF